MPPAPSEITDVFDDQASVSTSFSAFTTDLQSTKSISGRRRTISTSSTLIGPTPPSTPTAPVLPPLEMQGPQLPRFERPITHDSPMESPPFSHTTGPYTHKAVANHGEISKTTARTERRALRGKEKEFRERRMRAAKLAKFFGVHYHDLEPHLVPEGQVARVEVAFEDRGMLPWDRHELRSLEMEDVIVRLRDLRSS